jgi:hypothetical protein
MARGSLAQAQRHVREGEQRVAEQTKRIVRMKANGDPEWAIAAGESVLATLRQSLVLAREDLRFEQARAQRSVGE